MTTERKPGSRGAKEPMGNQRATQPISDRVGGSDGRKTDKPKGSTKTASPRKGFKTRKRK